MNESSHRRPVILHCLRLTTKPHTTTASQARALLRFPREKARVAITTKERVSFGRRKNYY
eukprot:scaffold1112_cov92-Amphora_coffeaeformis.AAC.19